MPKLTKHFIDTKISQPEKGKNSITATLNSLDSGSWCGKLHVVLR